MFSFTKIFVSVLFLIMMATAFLSSSQGWWWYGIRSPQVMNEYKEENMAYIHLRASGGNFTQGSHLRRSGMASRSFRSGSRSGRGK